VVCRIEAGPGKIFSATLNRTGDSAYRGTATFAEGIPVGNQTLSLSAYSEQNGNGSVVGQAQEVVQVRAAQVGVDQDHPVLQPGQGQGQVGGDDALANPALAAADGQHHRLGREPGDPRTHAGGLAHPAGGGQRTRRVRSWAAWQGWHG
jgi:orotidine-5'-phosphate decarboxylase